jgi:hypothetical protein
MKLGTKIVDGIGAATRRMRRVLLLGSYLFLASASLAQMKVDPLHAATTRPPQPAMLGAAQDLQAAKTAESKAASSAAPARGPHEGIQVHGYWTIEVRNPDGSVTAHREFENALQRGGQNFLSSVLGAQYSSSGGLAIMLNGAGIDFQQVTIYNSFISSGTVVDIPNLGGESGPCGQFNYYWYIPYNFGTQTETRSSGEPSGATCFISAGNLSGKTTESLPASWCIGPGQQVGCSTNLVVSSPQVGSLAAPLLLSGSITVPASVNPGNVTDVETLITECDVNTTPSNCANYWDLSGTGFRGWPLSSANFVGVATFTQKNLDSQNGDPAPVPYQPGQTIAVTVQISFQ